MSTQHITAQRIEAGPAQASLTSLDMAGPILVVGSARSVALVEWGQLAEPVAVFEGSTRHNPFPVVESARERARTTQVKTVVAIGSASAIDLGKAIVEEHTAALVAVPTTLGGSEMSRVYGTRHEDGSKRGGGGRALLPAVVCYDSTLLRSLSKQMLVASGVNAWAHSIEALYARREHWIGKACAAESGRSLPGLLLGTGEVNPDLLIHERLFEAACQAGFALNVCGMGLHHAICHVLGGLTGVGHAALNFAVLAAAVQTNARKAPVAVNDVLAAIEIEDVGGVIGRLAESFDVASTLRELGITREQLTLAVPAVMAAHHLKNNPAVIDEADVETTLTAAYEGSALPS